MAHLGDRVTALVDDALDEREWCSVQEHLLACETCRDAVRRERHLKSRMTCGRMAPAPPAALVAALADRQVLAEHVARQERRRLAGLHAAVTVGGLCASLTVLGLICGGSSPVRPQPAGVVRGVQPASAVVPSPSEPARSGEMTGARNGRPTRSQVPTMLSPAPGTVPVSVVGRPLL